MAVTQVQLSTLGELDAELVEGFNDELRRAVLDVQKRRGITKHREVGLRIRIVPDSDDMDNVKIVAEVVSKLPSRRAKVLTGQVRAAGMLVVNPDSPDDPSQMTIDEA